MRPLPGFAKGKPENASLKPSRSPVWRGQRNWERRRPEPCVTFEAVVFLNRLTERALYRYSVALRKTVNVW